MKRLLTFIAILLTIALHAETPEYQKSAKYQQLLQAMSNGFDAMDSTKFFTAVKALEDYTLEQGDLHTYYTQRCNEIVFLMNGQKIFEAYKLANQLSKELREKKLDSEMYMAVNMMGHIYRYCGNKETAKSCWREVLRRMEAAGYRESMPPIYMNIVNVEMSDNPEEALRLLEEARRIAAESSSKRVFDIDTRRTVAYYELEDSLRFSQGYEAYAEGAAEGLTSVHGRQLEVYHLAFIGKTDDAIRMADKELGADAYETKALIYSRAGRWHEAYLALERKGEVSDSLNAVILANSMRGIDDELKIYEAEKKAANNYFIMLFVIIVSLLLLLAAMAYILYSRRRHVRQLQSAYQHALESDNMKAAFIKNVSHEVRTPLNIISGFAQVIADPTLDTPHEERQHIAQMVLSNTRAITQLIDEMLSLSLDDSGAQTVASDNVLVVDKLRAIIAEAKANSATHIEPTLKSSLSDSFVFITNDSMFTRAIAPLLDNAMKFAPQHGIVTITADITNDDTLTISIEDNGCGIPPEEAEHIFERFVKLDRFKVGIGLGLTLARTTARHLGGDVRLDSTYSKGARFVLTLPLNK